MLLDVPESFLCYTKQRQLNRGREAPWLPTYLQPRATRETAINTLDHHLQRRKQAKVVQD